jgi:hypothetical protein
MNVLVNTLDASSENAADKSSAPPNSPFNIFNFSTAPGPFVDDI